MESADVGGNTTGDTVSDEVKDSKERKRRDATGNLAGYSLPVSDGEAGETSEFAD